MSFSIAPPRLLGFFADWAYAEIEKAIATINVAAYMAWAEIRVLRAPLIGPPVVDETANTELLQP
jgi:hypothetical protein